MRAWRLGLIAWAGVALAACGGDGSGGGTGGDGGRDAASDAAPDAASDGGASDAGDGGSSTDAGDGGTGMEGGASGCTDNGECDRSQYCAKDSCEAASGTCTTRPRLCPDVYSPVCGCDGRTYGNRCQATAAGVDVASEGECGGGDGMCADDGDCAAGEFCQKDACDAARGTCATRPEVCPGVYAPVCGCDGMTYGNACQARSAGVNVASEGECTTRPPGR